MGKIIVVLALSVLLAVYAYIFYRIGYGEREKKFQEKPITFVVGNERPLCRKKRRDGVCENIQRKVG